MGEAGRRAEQEAAAAEAEAVAAGTTGTKAKEVKDAAAKGAVKTAKKRTRKNAAELDIDSAFGEDAGGF